MWSYWPKLTSQKEKNIFQSILGLLNKIQRKNKIPIYTSRAHRYLTNNPQVSVKFLQLETSPKSKLGTLEKGVLYSFIPLKHHILWKQS